MEFNSLDALREAAVSYVASQKHEGWILVGDRFDDGGFSGGLPQRQVRLKEAAERSRHCWCRSSAALGRLRRPAPGTYMQRI